MGREQLVQAVNNLREVVHQPGFPHVLSYIVMNETLFFSKQSLRERNRFQLISFHETSLILSLLSEIEFDQTELSDDAISVLYSICKSMLEEVHRAISSYSTPANVDELFVSGKTFIEPVYYCASAAHWFDYLDLAPKIYDLDSAKLEEVGFDVSSCCNVIKALSRVQQARIRDFMREATRRYRRDGTTTSPINHFIFSFEDVGDIEQGEFETFFRWMTVTPGTSPSVVDPIAFHPVKARPALRLPCGRIFAPNLAMLAEQVFESPYFAITADRSYFAANANNRGAWRSGCLRMS